MMVKDFKGGWSWVFKGGHPPAFASLPVPLRFSKGEFGFLAALGMTGRGARLPSGFPPARE